MSDLFRKEALSRRSRALFGEIILRSPLSNLIVIGLIAIVLTLIGFILIGLPIGDQSVLEWVRRDQ